MNNKYSANLQSFLIFILIFISLFINQYYAMKGAFPIESFAHYDISLRILSGDVPFRDYWAVSGIFIDYLQSLFFLIFGDSFQIYVLHASVFNVTATLISFIFFKELKLGNFTSFFYAVCFSILAYPTTGTLYVDHHASLICFISSVLLFKGIKSNDRVYIFIIPILVGIAFFTKPAPTIYILIFYILILSIYIFFNKKFYLINILIISSCLFIVSIFLFGLLNNISFNNFLNQYILFPTTIADDRYSDLEFSIKNLIFNFNFIYVFLAPIIFFYFKNIYKNKSFLISNKSFYYLIIFGLSFSLIFHQINTKNQLFILFLIPILSSFLHYQLNEDKIKYSKQIIFLICLISFSLTLKYHFRFNEDRKFHELQYVDFTKAVDANLIDKKLNGLNWITPINPNNPQLEVNQVKTSLESIKKINTKSMIITNYSFYSSVLNRNTNSPSRWFIPNGGAYPVDKKNPFFKEYKNILTDIIGRKKIESIIIVKPVEVTEITRYLNPKCLDKNNLDEITLQLKIKKNCNFK
jgi:hypothetical protein